jgi:hypothetical protein
VKYLCILIALSAMSLDVYADNSEPAVRPLDAWAGETVTRATASSTVVRSLVAEIQAANVIVHVETAQVMPTEVAGYTRFVAAVNGYRYVRVTLARNLPPRYRAAILGHELQHVWEIAASGAADTEGVRRLFERLGSKNNSRAESFETKEAVVVERRVSKELRGPRLPVPGSR